MVLVYMDKNILQKYIRIKVKNKIDQLFLILGCSYVGVSIFTVIGSSILLKVNKKIKDKIKQP